jgi:hypothetical protein
MAQEKSTVLVAVFHTLEEASKAYQDLRGAGFGDDYLGLANPQETRTGLGNHLENAGIPEEESAFYQREFAAGHPLVTVRVGGIPHESIEKAAAILRNDGGYNAQGQHLTSDVRKDAKSPFFDLAPNRGENEPK